MSFPKLSKFRSRAIWKDGFTISVGIIASIETILAISDFGINDLCPTMTWWGKAIVIGLVFGLTWVITVIIKAWRANISISLKIRNIAVDIKVGDIFSAPTWKLIPFNEFFDTQVDDVIIAYNSLNGILITNHIPDINDLNASISQGTANLKKHKKANRYAYQLGSIITYQDYLLLAFARFDNNQAKLTQNEYEECLRTMWHEVSRTYALRPVTIPLLGGGITRFENTIDKNEAHLLRCILCTLKTSNAQIYQPITIYLTEKAINNIDLYTIKKIF